MNRHLLPKQFRMYIIYAAAAMIFLLPFLPANAGGDLPFYLNVNKKSGWQRAGPEPRMFLIAVIDSKDDIIGERCKEDLDGITDEFEYVAQKIGVRWIEPKIVEGDAFGKAAVNDAIDNWLKNQQPSGDDIVVFYYSGHGFRNAADKSEFPRMWLKTATDRDVETNNLRMEEDIYDRIVKMGAGINIVLSDCCNNIVADANANVGNNVTVSTRKRSHTDEPGTDDENNGHKLFTAGEPMSILATAAGKGELASGKAEDGGFFTAFFLDDLDYVISHGNEEASWEAIFKYADENASELAKSAVCPVTAVRNPQGRCLQTVTVKIEGGN